ncbi:cell wall-active antibiotics response protein LiaF [Alteribacter populi]|uniref:cell wall-active antibiotics response protein LiaF n=1 Tax=Alteribacter populi TaxID=2011011 RepID=UPI000BBB2F79|nr:cell wall-active antibiotics response protein LiaF [Alteribacter populi]
MFQRISTEAFNWIFLIGAVLFVFEVLFFGGGFAFGVIFLALLLYIGRKYYHKLIGKLCFWIGLVSLVFTVLNLMAVRFLFISLVCLFFYRYYRSKKDPETLEPEFGEQPGSQVEPMVYVLPLFKNRFIGQQKTSEVPYAWRDINIQGGIGDRIIDLSNTVIPDNAIISIRHGVGNIKIFVPYEVEVSVSHSAWFGRATIFQEKNTKLFNQQLAYQTAEYDERKPRVKIVTSVLSGDIEVKRI